MTPLIGRVRLVLSIQEAEALLWFIGFDEARHDGRSKYWPSFLSEACQKIKAGLLEYKQGGEDK